MNDAVLKYDRGEVRPGGRTVGRGARPTALTLFCLTCVLGQVPRVWDERTLATLALPLV